jgi:hypothetical protein
LPRRRLARAWAGGGRSVAHAAVRRFRPQFKPLAPAERGPPRIRERLGSAKEDGPDKRLGCAGNWASRPSRQECEQRRTGKAAQLSEIHPFARIFHGAGFAAVLGRFCEAGQGSRLEAKHQVPGPGRRPLQVDALLNILLTLASLSWGPSIALAPPAAAGAIGAVDGESAGSTWPGWGDEGTRVTSGCRVQSVFASVDGHRRTHSGL